MTFEKKIIPGKPNKTYTQHLLNAYRIYRLFLEIYDTLRNEKTHSNHRWHRHTYINRSHIHGLRIEKKLHRTLPNATIGESK